MINKLYTEVDIRNLSTASVRDLRSLSLVDDLLVKDFTKDYIFNNLDSLLVESKFKTFLDNVLFSTKGSIKWFRLKFSDTFTESDLYNALRNLTVYNVNLRDSIEVTLKQNSIIGVVEVDDIFTLKVLINDGTLKRTNGLKYIEEDILKVIIVKINIEERWLEIRGSEKHCKRVKKVIEKELEFEYELDSIRVLNKYNNDVESFKNDLAKGFYLNSISMPVLDVVLTLEHADKLKSIFNEIEKYLNNEENNLNRLKDILDNANLPTEVTLRELMLAGLDSFNIKIKDDSTQDISKQAFYSIFKEYLIENTGYISFKNINTGEEYTIQIGVNANNIRFMTNATEEIISYIRSKIV